MEKEPRGVYRETKRSDVLALVIGLFCVLVVVMVSRNFLTQVRYEEDHDIAVAIEKLKNVFTTISETAQIVSFKGQKAPINFLTVKSFVGSFVGPLQMGYPEEWKGPYMTESLEVQGKEYQLVSTKKGIYIVPGDGVRLANGKVIGGTLKFTEEADIDAMLTDPAQLQSNSKPLAVKLAITHKPAPVSRVVDFDEQDDLTNY
ncbi:hypothetical protein H0W26_05470 [Candidatus Dependentiae bacterium]|nr:hypothetical protein [Candidatus Dependentiae bacterium]